MQTVRTIGLDIAKSVFRVHGVDADGQVVIRRQLRRTSLPCSTATLPWHPCREPPCKGRLVRSFRGGPLPVRSTELPAEPERSRLPALEKIADCLAVHSLQPRPLGVWPAIRVHAPHGTETVRAS